MTKIKPSNKILNLNIKLLFLCLSLTCIINPTFANEDYELTDIKSSIQKEEEKKREQAEIEEARKRAEAELESAKEIIKGILGLNNYFPYNLSGEQLQKLEKALESSAKSKQDLDKDPRNLIKHSEQILAMVMLAKNQVKPYKYILTKYLTSLSPLEAIDYIFVVNSAAKKKYPSLNNAGLSGNNFFADIAKEKVQELINDFFADKKIVAKNFSKFKNTENTIRQNILKNLGKHEKFKRTIFYASKHSPAELANILKKLYAIEAAVILYKNTFDTNLNLFRSLGIDIPTEMQTRFANIEAITALRKALLDSLPVTTQAKLIRTAKTNLPPILENYSTALAAQTLQMKSRENPFNNKKVVKKLVKTRQIEPGEFMQASQEDSKEAASKVLDLFKNVHIHEALVDFVKDHKEVINIFGGINEYFEFINSQVREVVELKQKFNSAEKYLFELSIIGAEEITSKGGIKKYIQFIYAKNPQNLSYFEKTFKEAAKNCPKMSDLTSPVIIHGEKLAALRQTAEDGKKKQYNPERDKYALGIIAAHIQHNPKKYEENSFKGLVANAEKQFSIKGRLKNLFAAPVNNFPRNYSELKKITSKIGGGVVGYVGHTAFKFFEFYTSMWVLESFMCMYRNDSSACIAQSRMHYEDPLSHFGFYAFITAAGAFNKVNSAYLRHNALNRYLKLNAGTSPTKLQARIKSRMYFAKPQAGQKVEKFLSKGKFSMSYKGALGLGGYVGMAIGFLADHFTSDHVRHPKTAVLMHKLRGTEKGKTLNCKDPTDTNPIDTSTWRDCFFQIYRDATLNGEWKSGIIPKTTNLIGAAVASHYTKGVLGMSNRLITKSKVYQNFINKIPWEVKYKTLNSKPGKVARKIGGFGLQVSGTVIFLAYASILPKVTQLENIHYEKKYANKLAKAKSKFQKTVEQHNQKKLAQQKNFPTLNLLVEKLASVQDEITVKTNKLLTKFNMYTGAGLIYAKLLKHFQEKYAENKLIAAQSNTNSQIHNYAKQWQIIPLSDKDYQEMDEKNRIDCAKATVVINISPVDKLKKSDITTNAIDLENCSDSEGICFDEKVVLNQKIQTEKKAAIVNDFNKALVSYKLTLYQAVRSCIDIQSPIELAVDEVFIQSYQKELLKLSVKNPQLNEKNPQPNQLKLPQKPLPKKISIDAITLQKLKYYQLEQQLNQVVIMNFNQDKANEDFVEGLNNLQSAYTEMRSHYHGMLDAKRINYERYEFDLNKNHFNTTSFYEWIFEYAFDKDNNFWQENDGEWHVPVNEKSSAKDLQKSANEIKDRTYSFFCGPLPEKAIKDTKDFRGLIVPFIGDAPIVPSYKKDPQTNQRDLKWNKLARYTPETMSFRVVDENISQKYGFCKFPKDSGHERRVESLKFLYENNYEQIRQSIGDYILIALFVAEEKIQDNLNKAYKALREETIRAYLGPNIEIIHNEDGSISTEHNSKLLQREHLVGKDDDGNKHIFDQGIKALLEDQINFIESACEQNGVKIADITITNEVGMPVNIGEFLMQQAENQLNFSTIQYDIFTKNIDEAFELAHGARMLKNTLESGINNVIYASGMESDPYAQNDPYADSRKKQKELRSKQRSFLGAKRNNNYE